MAVRVGGGVAVRVALGVCVVVRVDVRVPLAVALVSIPLLKGRTFLRADNSTNAPPVVVCSEATARKIFPKEDPIGKLVQFDNEDKKFEIIGMVGDVKLTKITDDRADKIYFSQGGNGSLIVRTRVASMSLVTRLIRSPVRFSSWKESESRWICE